MPLASCGDDNVSDEERLNPYTIVKGDTLLEQKVCQTGLAFSSTTITGTNLNAHEWHWNYDRDPVFFDATCSLSKEELKSFANIYRYDSHFEEEAYSCLGTDLYSYSERYTDDKSDYMVKVPEESGIYIPFLVCDLIEYVITPKNGGESFTIYGSATEPHLTLIKAH